MSYDIGRQVKAIEAFEAQAMKSAEETKEVADKELGSLEKTLANIIGCRPWEELDVVCNLFFLSFRLSFFGGSSLGSRYVFSFLLGFGITETSLILSLAKIQDDICAAAPEIDRRTELLVENGRWNVPGYKVFNCLSCILHPLHPLSPLFALSLSNAAAS